MSIPVGHTCTQIWQSMQSPSPASCRSTLRPRAPRGSPRLSSYAITSVSLSNITDWKRAYGHMYLHTCSRIQPALPYVAKP